MSEIRTILLCSSRFALPTMQQLVFFQQLTAVAIPEQCDEMIEQTEVVLKGTTIPILKLDKKKFVHQLCDAIRVHEIDLGLMMTFSFKLPASVYDLPAKGFFNVHPGPLPSYRGADPIFQQIKNRETQAGVTIHKIDDGFDTGPVVTQERIRLETTDTYGILTTKLSVVAARLVAVIMKLVEFGVEIPSRVQDEKEATYYKKQKSKDVCINWQTMSANDIVALINACNPWNKGAVTKIQNSVIRLLIAQKTASPIDSKNPPGTILTFENGKMRVATISNEPIDVEMIFLDEGFLKAGDLIHRGINPGTVFEEIQC